MNFTIFRNFSGIFLNLFDFYFDFFIFKLIKKMQKCGFYRVCTRGISTWTSTRAYVALR